MSDGPTDMAAAYKAVDDLADWSEWRPFVGAATAAPQTPGVYVFRLPGTHEVVYVGMAGPRTGSGTAQGLRGRLSIYGRGHGAVSGFGEAALDRALGDEDWLESQLASLRTNGPKRAKVWAQEALAFVAPEVRWAECAGKTEALALEKHIEFLLGMHGLWNRAAERLRAGHGMAGHGDLGGAADEVVTESPVEPCPDGLIPASETGDLVVFTLHGHAIDLDVLYREMYGYSVLIGAERVFNGLAKGTPAVKRLLSELFDVPVTDKIHPVNNAIRSECRDRLDVLGWATKGPGRSARYVLHREL